MTFQLVEREVVDFQALHLFCRNREISLGFGRKLVDFVELLQTDEASQTLTILHDAAGVVAAYARHTSQQRGVGSIQVERLALAEFLRIAQRVGTRHGCIVGKERRGRCIVRRDAYVRLQLPILLDGESVEAGKVFLFPIHAPSSPVLIDVAHLPWLQAQAQQLGTVGLVGVEGK